jgi:transcriptional regulator GlxA family with amidase domain
MSLSESQPLPDVKTWSNEVFPVRLQVWPSDPRVREVLRRFQIHLDRPLRIGELAKSVLLSRSRFGDLFRRETASSPARLLKTLRLNEARRILAASNLSVKEVAARVGINDLSHFVRDFQAAFGLSPARYKKQLQTSKDETRKISQEDPCKNNQVATLTT